MKVLTKYEVELLSSFGILQNEKFTEERTGYGKRYFRQGTEENIADILSTVDTIRNYMKCTID